MGFLKAVTALLGLGKALGGGSGRGRHAKEEKEESISLAATLLGSGEEDGE